LNEPVGRCSRHLPTSGVAPGDVVAAAQPNIPQAIVALLGTAAVGAIWSVVNVDFGVTGIVSRFKQLAPKVLITIDALELGGKLRDQTDDLDALLTQLDSVSHHILVENAGPQVSDTVAQITAKHQLSTTRYADIIAQPREPEFAPVEFSHPLWVLYSSGTTGTPKGIDQGHGGTVLEIAK